jgi:anhydro-N-acetylmuramic acid kinase
MIQEAEKLSRSLRAAKCFNFIKKNPKSLGFEFVKEVILPLIESFKILRQIKFKNLYRLLQTALLYLKKKDLSTGSEHIMIFFIERIQFYLPEMEIIIPN